MRISASASQKKKGESGMRDPEETRAKYAVMNTEYNLQKSCVKHVWIPVTASDDHVKVNSDR